MRSAAVSTTGVRNVNAKKNNGEILHDVMDVKPGVMSLTSGFAIKTWSNVALVFLKPVSCNETDERNFFSRFYPRLSFTTSEVIAVTCERPCSHPETLVCMYISKIFTTLKCLTQVQFSCFLHLKSKMQVELRLRYFLLISAELYTGTWDKFYTRFLKKT